MVNVKKRKNIYPDFSLTRQADGGAICWYGRGWGRIDFRKKSEVSFWTC
jgi:hypothetical protein